MTGPRDKYFCRFHIIVTMERLGFTDVVLFTIHVTNYRMQSQLPGVATVYYTNRCLCGCCYYFRPVESTFLSGGEFICMYGMDGVVYL